MSRHLAAAFSLVGSRPWAVIPDYSSKVHVEMDTFKAASQVWGYARSKRPLAFDLETTTLKPDGPHAEILCCGVSDGLTATAFPWHGGVIQEMKKILTDGGVPKIASSLRFEERWVRKKLGTAVHGWSHDTVLGAHWRDCRRGICGLKFQAFVRLGVEDYSSHLDAYVKSQKENCNSPNRLKEVEPMELMRYCGLDALFECLVAESQKGGA